MGDHPADRHVAAVRGGAVERTSPPNAANLQRTDEETRLTLFKKLDHPPPFLDERVDPRRLGVEEAGDLPLLR